MRTDRPSGSVLIAAHDEAASIGRALETLLGDAEPGEFRVVVACNGCSDDTAARARATARRLGQAVEVLELPIASKAAAWRAAEQVTSQPRLYLDADVLCPTETARQLLRALERHDVAVPTRLLDHSHGSDLARLYYSGWSRLPWVAEQLAGRGAFALSPSARATFGAFPDLVADDRFATSRVARDHAVVVPGGVVVRPPATIRDVVAVRTRALHGNAAPEVPSHDRTRGQRLAGLAEVGARPVAWPALGVYLTVTLLVKLRVGTTRAASAPWARAARTGAQ